MEKIGIELPEYRYVSEDNDNIYTQLQTRIYSLTNSVGPFKYICTMAYSHIGNIGKSAIRGHVYTTPEGNLQTDSDAVWAMDDGVVNEVEIIEANANSDEAHEAALKVAHDALLHYWEEDKHLFEVEI